MIPERYQNFLSEISGKFPIGNFGKLPLPIPIHISWPIYLKHLFVFWPNHLGLVSQNFPKSMPKFLPKLTLQNVKYSR